MEAASAGRIGTPVKLVVVKCDICKREKEAVNHWYMGNVTVEHGLPQSVEILSWKDYSADDYDHLCGRECAQKYVEKFLSGNEME